ncbi:FtsX-like permease family protein [Nitrospirillum iridis]|uniref:Cell division protein FtsX n=1 Tax=Nitrospirillum iridis TaxID=765888 RepID=A0A7X0AV19_9PROT|nr:FtsX-like permease family protein [Nitrospirillum iridis]MBB6250595.1 cell division protein FtsX [Nitrospirillum iridis]
MIPVRVKKAGCDFGVRWGRTLLAFSGLAIGLFVTGAVLAAYSLLRTDLEAGYRRTNPPNLVLRTDAVTPEILRRLADLPGVTAVEQRPLVMARAEVRPGRWLPLELAVVDDFRALRVATFTPEAGLPADAWPPPVGGLLVERDGRYFLDGGPGTTLPLRFSDGASAAAAFSGYVFDPGQHPSRMEMVLYGYVTRATLAAWGQGLDGSRLLLTTSGPDSATTLAPTVTAALAAAGVGVRRLEIHDQPRYGHQNQLDALMLLMAGLAVTTLGMGTVLVVNLIDALMTRERRAIGVMRALGARPEQVARDYLLATGFLGLAAGLASLWPALAMGTVIARFIAAGNNFDLLSPHPPLWVWAAVLAFGAGAPLAVTAWRVRQAMRMPVRLALLRGGGASAGAAPGTGALARVFTVLPLLVRLALGAVLRRPRPAVLTALVLAIGLAFFLTALNVRASMQGTAAAVMRTKPYDVQLVLRQAYPTDRLQAWMTGRSEVRAAEYWRGVEAVPMVDGRRLANPVAVVAPPAGTRMIRPDVLAGHWLDGADAQGVVVTQKLLADVPDLRLGGRYQLRTGERAAAVTVVGVVREFGPGRVYASAAVMDTLRGAASGADILYLTLAAGSSPRPAAQALQDDLAAAGIPVMAAETAETLVAIIDGHLALITTVLMAIAVLALLTGVLGLAACIGVSVAERAREVGVMKAMGGGGAALIRLFIYEAMAIALVGWAIALALAPLISRPVVGRFGQRIIRYPFDYQDCSWGAFAGLGVAVLVAVLAAAMPAAAAARTPVATTLRTE